METMKAPSQFYE